MISMIMLWAAGVPVMDERRRTLRRRTYLGARIAFGTGALGADCIVRNLSGGGAKIMFSDRAVVPTEFELTIAQKRETVRARIVWRQADMAGVALYPG
jgi:hypothetical protein